MYRQKRKNKSSEVVRKFKDFGFIAAKKGNNTNIGGQWQPTPVLLPGKSHGRRSLVGYSPWGCEELDTTERLHFHFLFSCIGEGNGNPLQCSCLENPRDGEAWWAAVSGVEQSRTRLKRFSSTPFYPPTVSVQGCQFPHILTISACFFFLVCVIHSCFFA